MKKEEKTLQEFLESIPALEKSELGVLRGGFSAVAVSGGISPLGNVACNCNCTTDIVCSDNSYCDCGCGTNVVCGCPYPGPNPANGDFSVELSFM